MSGLSLGFALGDTLVTLQSAPAGSHTLVVCDGLVGSPALGTWASEISTRGYGKIVSVSRTTTRLLVGSVLATVGASSMTAVAVDSTDGAQVTLWPDGTRIIRLADVSRTLS